jgi:hypothetical protein
MSHFSIFLQNIVLFGKNIKFYFTKQSVITKKQPDSLNKNSGFKIMALFSGLCLLSIEIWRVSMVDAVAKLKFYLSVATPQHTYNLLS